MTTLAPLPYGFLPEVPSFTLTSENFKDGDRLPDVHAYSHGNVSPQLSWSGFPAETQSFAITCFDPDAPTGSGWWHWLLTDIPTSITSLTAGAEAPAGTVSTPSDYQEQGYGGAAPPKGPEHRYVFAVHALDVSTLELDGDENPARVGFSITAHTIARGILVATFSS